MAEQDGRAPSIRLELRRSERERIQRAAAASGYRSLTDYVRTIALERSDRICAERDREMQAA